MDLSRAEVRTANSVHYLRQLCRHWSQSFTVEFDDTHGKVHLPQGIVTLMSGTDALSVYVETAAAHDQERLEEVVAELLRLVAREETPELHWLHC